VIHGRFAGPPAGNESYHPISSSSTTDWCMTFRRTASWAP
jgi:hypothetical protein